MNRRISIPKPCNENWDKMTPNNNGKYCDVCKLTVVDFTSMNDDEIQNYLVNKSYVCGRFDCSQINSKTNNRLAAMKSKAEHIAYPLLRYFILTLFALPLFISSCINRSSKEKAKGINVSGIDTPRRPLMGNVVMPKHVKPSPKKIKHP